MRDIDLYYLVATIGADAVDLSLLNSFGSTVPLDVGPPPMILLELKREAPEILNYCHLRREPRVKDWEQRQRKRRRK